MSEDLPFGDFECAELELRLAETPGAFWSKRERRLIATVGKLRRDVLRLEMERQDANATLVVPKVTA